MMNQPKVSLIVPVYNAEKWLPESFRSFEAQTYRNIEWILVDDGSTDGSADLCTVWCDADPVCRKLVRKRNGGASSARNVGLDNATGDCVLFWDCDDVQSPDAVRKMVDSLPGKDGVAVCALRRVEPNGSYQDLFTCDRATVSSERAIRMWLEGKVSTGPITKLVPRELLLDNGIRFEEGITNEDVMWTAEVLAAAGSVVLMGESLYRYIAREGSVTMSFSPKTVNVFDNCRKLESFISAHFPDLVDCCNMYCARSCWNVALSASRGGNKKKYPEVYARAMLEIGTRKVDLVKWCATPKDRALRFLVKTGLYGLLRK